MVPFELLVMKRSPPAIARPGKPTSPVTSEALTSVPEVVYSLTMPLEPSIERKMSPPETPMPDAPLGMSEGLTIPPRWCIHQSRRR